MMRGPRLLLAVAIILLLVTLSGSAQAATSAITQETPLNPDGIAYEVNADDYGRIWVSDCDANEIRMYNPNQNFYNIIKFNFPGATILPCPSDARADLAENVWFLDTNSTAGRFGRLAGGDWTAVTYWEAQEGGDPGGYTLWGDAFDNAGNVWMTDTTRSYVYRFYAGPDWNDFCEFALPDSASVNSAGFSYYALPMDDTIWLADFYNNDILRLHPGGNPAYWERWNLPGEGEIRGMALDKYGNLWFADWLNNRVGRLIPDTNSVMMFTDPDWTPENGGFTTSPQAITAQGAKIWVTTNSTPSMVVSLDPLSPDLIEPEPLPVTYTGRINVGDTSCRLLSPISESAVVEAPPGNIDWNSDVAYIIDDRGSGWVTYTLPTNSGPWGITNSGIYVYFVDQYRKVLGRITDLEHWLFLPSITRQ